MTSDRQASPWPASAVPAAYLRPGNGSFTEFLADAAPHLLPGVRAPEVAAAALPHATTIVAATCADGVVMAGDRRATMGNIIAQRDIEKVFIADSHSAIGIAGTAGMAVEMVRLFRLELEHYEKIEGVRLSLDGKANRLATMIRGNLGMAMQGLAVVPLFAGLEDATAFGADLQTPESVVTGPGRIFSYDIAGGKYEEHDYFAVGSGSMFARSALKKRYEAGADLADDGARNDRGALRRGRRRQRHRRAGPDPADLPGGGVGDSRRCGAVVRRRGRRGDRVRCRRTDAQARRVAARSVDRERRN